MPPELSDYTGKRVLVTGADGFIGSHLTEALVAAGARVIPFVRGTSTNTGGSPPFRRIPLPPARFEQVLQGDISAPDTVELVARARPSVILHLAAIAWVDYSFDHPGEVFRTNAGGTLHVLEAARRIDSVERVVVMSSSEVYGSRRTPLIAEDHPLMPTSPYAASKAAADRLAYSWWNTWKLPVVILRPFNTYGPRHTYDVIPRFLRLALRHEPLTVYGSGEQERDFNYVEDTVRGILLAGLAPGAVGEVINLGTGTAVTVSHLARTIITLSASRSPVVHLPGRKAEVESLLCDATRAHRVLGYETRISLEEGLARNIAWERGRTAAV